MTESCPPDGGSRRSCPPDGGSRRSRPPDGGSGRSRPPDGGCGRSRPLDGGSGRSRPPDGGCGRSCPPDGGCGRSCPPDGGSGWSCPPDGGSGRSRPPDGGSGRSRPPDGGSGWSRPPDGGSRRSRPPDGGSGRSRPPDGGSGRSRPPDGGSGRSCPPDGGYGWVVVLSAFWVMGLTAAVLKNYGLFLLDVQAQFGLLTSTTSWITSCTIVMFHLGAPAASALTLMCSQRLVIMTGGLLCASAMVLASLDLSLPCLYLTMGLLQGAGVSFSWIPANSMVSHYFVRWRPVAYAVASSGECVFAIIFGPFFQWLIETYGWRGALLVIGGLQLNICVCGALMRPLDQGAPSLLPKRTRTFQCSLLRKPELLLYITFAILAAAGIFISPLFLVPFANSLGLYNYWPASILSLVALADLVGRLICGWVANMKLWRNLRLLTVAVSLLGLVLVLLPVCTRSLACIMVLFLVYGFLFGCVVAIHVTSIVDIVSLEGFDSGLGLFMLFRSIGGCFGPPLAGFLVDQMGTYSAAFYLSGLCLISSAFFVILVDNLVQKKDALNSMED